ncbi:MAG: type II toxin-antitoxin system RelE/ParE family toxin [Bacteroidaceae bacterium]|nr:type II toxin-antitoxin system RelE/ParE family toxin [Bacteroidaceae bacterium]
MKVIWMPFAQNEVRKTARYINKEFGKESRDQFISEVRKVNRLLGENPNLGKPEPLLADYAKKYRSYVMSHLNKVVYWISDNQIEVVDFWDVRRDPTTLKNQI